MNYVKINGEPFDVGVAISDYEESFNVLDGENAGRAMTGRMVRDVIGTYIGHRITFFNPGGVDGNTAFDRLWDYLKAHSVDDSVMLEAVDGQNAIQYEAYYTSASRKLRTVSNGTNYWDELQVNFVPMEAQIAP